MKRALAILGILGMAFAPATVRADEPTVDCSPLTCVSVHVDALLDCSSDGRPIERCDGDLIYEVAFDTPNPFESMDYQIDTWCSVACDGDGQITGTCGWAPPEVRPFGETGCMLSDVIEVTFPIAVAPNTCTTFVVGISAAVRTVLDPIPRAGDTSTSGISICVD